MPCELRWLASASTSAFHAAEAMARGLKLADSRLASAAAESVAELQRLLASVGLAPNAFWRHVVPLSTDIDSNRGLADVVLRKLVPSSSRSAQAVESMAAVFTELERARAAERSSGR